MASRPLTCSHVLIEQWYSNSIAIAVSPTSLLTHASKVMASLGLPTSMRKSQMKILLRNKCSESIIITELMKLTMNLYPFARPKAKNRKSRKSIRRRIFRRKRAALWN